MRIALTIAGSDPSGGAGIQADLKTFHQFGVYGEAVITLATVQNTMRTERVLCLPPDLIAQQIRAVVEDIPPHAVKIGALGNRGIVQAVVEAAGSLRVPLILDPVMIGKNGALLLGPDAHELLLRKLIPKAFLVTPNLPEAEALTGIAARDLASMRDAAESLAAAGAKNVLIKGGHLESDPVDLLLYDGQWIEYAGVRIPTRHTHGTGCTYAAAITAGLAKGRNLPNAVADAKRFVEQAIRTAPNLGHGAGPVNHFAVI